MSKQTQNKQPQNKMNRPHTINSANMNRQAPIKSQTFVGNIHKGGFSKARVK